MARRDFLLAAGRECRLSRVTPRAARRRARYSASGSRKCGSAGRSAARTCPCRAPSRTAAARGERARRRSSGRPRRPAPGEPEDLAGELVPRDLAAVGEVVDARSLPPRAARRWPPTRSVVAVGRPTWSVTTESRVLPDSDLLQDRLDEVPARAAEEPRGAHDEAPGKAQRLLLAAPLGASVGRQRADGIVLDVRRALLAVEDEVGRDLDELRAERAARVGQKADGRRVDLDGARIGLAVVDLRERRAVDDDVRASARGRRARDRGRVRHVELGARPREDVVTRGCERGNEVRSQHPGAAGDRIRRRRRGRGREARRARPRGRRTRSRPRPPCPRLARRLRRRRRGREAPLVLRAVELAVGRVAFLDRPPPVLVVPVPADRLDQALLERRRRREAEAARAWTRRASSAGRGPGGRPRSGSGSRACRARRGRGA